MKKLMILIIAISSLILMGCAEEKNSASTGPQPPIHTPPNGPYVPPGSGPGLGPGDNWEYGGTANLEIVNNERLADYTGHAINNPKDVRVNINLEKHGNGYGGHVSIHYTDDFTGYREPYEGYFTSLATGGGRVEDNAVNNQYNIWFQKNGKHVYHGFFEDFMGGIVVVIDQIIDLGDGDGPEDIVGGSVWYKNFGLSYAPISRTSCWFVSIGPYDCRAWKAGDGVDTTRAIYPDEGYRKLGDFYGLSIKEAFNGEINL